MKRSGNLIRKSAVGRVVGSLFSTCLTGLLVAGVVTEVPAQTMPGPVYFELGNSGHEALAKKISKKLELRADPGSEDVNKLLEQWRRGPGGRRFGTDAGAGGRRSAGSDPASR